MHKIIFLFAFLIQSSFAKAQEDARNFKIGFHISPQLSTAFIEKSPLVRYSPSLGITTGMNFHMDLSSKTQFIGGLELQYAKYDYIDYGPSYPGDFDTITFQVDHYASYDDYNYSHWFIGIPLLVKFKLGSETKSSHFFMTIGGTIRYRINTGGYLQIVENYTPTIRRNLETFFWKPKNTWIFGTIAFGYETTLGIKKIAFSPQFEYSHNYLYNDQGSSAIANGHPAYIGLKVSIY